MYTKKYFVIRKIYQLDFPWFFIIIVKTQFYFLGSFYFTVQ